MRATLLVIPLTLVALSGCPATPEQPGLDAGPDAPVPDGGGLSIDGVLPRSGPVAGGTVVTVSGTGFLVGAAVSFGEEAAIDVEVTSDSAMVCRTPPASAPGPVDVRVDGPDGVETAVLEAGFTYEAEPPAGIDSCRLEGPTATEAAAGSATETISGLVLATGATDGSGQGPGISGEVGFGADGSDPETGAWTWVGMVYVDDADDEDRYGGTMLVHAPGELDYAVRFTADAGATWVYCDLDGSEEGGYSADQAGSLTVTDTSTPQVDWCRVERPSSLGAAPGDESEPIFGQVFEPGVTEAPGQGSGVRGQVGYGPDGSSPAGEAWTWRDATYGGDVGDNDEYAATVQVDPPGRYDYAYRFSLDGGGSWLYCDLSSSDDGYAPANAGDLVVEVPSDPAVDWCNLQWPTTTSVEPGASSSPIFGRVYEEAVTEAPGRGAGISAELGYGPDGSSPEGSADWEWVGAAYTHDYGHNDEYSAALTIADEGTYDFAYRFSLDGTTWLYCDQTGSADGYDPAAAGSIEVRSAGPVLPTWCALWWPPSTATVEGVPTELIFGQVYEPGVTDSPGAGAGVSGQVGYGPDGAVPEGSPDWEWIDAAYNLDNGDNDEFMAVLVPTAAGEYDYAYRFSLDGGTTWQYCDQTGPADGYDPAEAGELSVAAADTVEWCNLQHPVSMSALSGETSEPIYGRVHEPGVTDAPGLGPGIASQVGYGPDGTDPSTGGWSWFDAAYNVDDGANNDEYAGTLVPAAAGTYDYAYRFSLDAGGTWVYCDGNGSSDGYAVAEAGELTVSD